ncbi:hypothetical protein THAOC_29885, partial [Thalassiosira oceanica]
MRSDEPKPTMLALRMLTSAKCAKSPVSAAAATSAQSPAPASLCSSPTSERTRGEEERWGVCSASCQRQDEEKEDESKNAIGRVNTLAEWLGSAVAANLISTCVSKQWNELSSDDELWEVLCKERFG